MTREMDKFANVDERGFAFMYQDDDELEAILVALIEKGVKWRTSDDLSLNDLDGHEGLNHPEGYVMVAYEANASEVAELPPFMQMMIELEGVKPFDGVCASCGSDPQREKDVPFERIFDAQTAVKWININL